MLLTIFAVALTLVSASSVVSSDAVTWAKSGHILTKGNELRGGLSGILADWNWQTRNVTALYIGSTANQALYKYDLAKKQLEHVIDVEGGVNALTWASHNVNAQTLDNDNAEIIYGSAETGKVFGLKRVDGAYVTRELTENTQLVQGVRSLAVTHHNDHLHAVTCDQSDTLWQYDSSPQRRAFCKVNEGYGCLGQTAFLNDNTLFGVSVRDRSVVRVYSGKAVKVADLPEGRVPVGVAVDEHSNVFVGVNSVVTNQRQAEIHKLDAKTGNLTLVAAVGGAVLDSFVVSKDNRVFLIDTAHTAVHEVQFLSFLHEESRLIQKSYLASGADHAGGAGAKNFFGHAAWRTHMLFGAETLTTNGGVAAWTTPDGTELALSADTFQLKSLTAQKFVDSWPLPGGDATRPGLLRAYNVHVQRLYEGDERGFMRPTIATNWEDGEVYHLSPFAPHMGDLELVERFAGFETPYGAARAQTGSILVADFTAGTIRQTDGFVAATDLEGPVGIAIGDNNGKSLYVSEWTAGRLTHIDVASGTKTVLLDSLDKPEGVAVNPLNGHVVVLETAGARRLLSVDPSKPGESTEIATNLPAGMVRTTLGEGHPYLMNGLAFADVSGTDSPGSHRSVALYASFDGDASVRRFTATQMLSDPAGKPRDEAGVKLPIVTENDGRRVATIQLWHPTLPAHVAVPAGVWLRFIARPFGQLHDDGHTHNAGVRWLTSEEIPNFRNTWLFPDSAANQAGKTPRGPSTYEILVNEVGVFMYRDAMYNAEGKLTVYDPAYDDPSNVKYYPDATGAPTPAPTPAPACRTIDTVVCPPGYGKIDAVTSPEGCLTDIKCTPEGYSYLTYPSQSKDGSPTNFHGGIAPYVPPGWTVLDKPIERPVWPGNAYPWKAWREWWQTARPGNADSSQYWYAPQHRVMLKPPTGDDAPFDPC